MQTQLKKSWPYIVYAVFLTPLVFDPFGVQVFEVPKMFYFIGVLSLALIAASILFFREKWDFFYEKKVLILAGLVLAVICASALFSISPVESFFGSFERGQGLLIQIYYLILFALLFNFLRNKEHRQTCLYLVIGIGTALSFAAFLQLLGIDVTGINNLAQMSGRPFSTLGQPNLLGQWLLVPILGLHILLQSPTGGKKNRILFIILLLINYLGLVLTMNKASFLGLAVALFLLYFNRKSKKTIAVLGMLLLLLIGGGLFLSTRSLSSRLLAWNGAIPSIIERPLLGHGQETYYITAQQNLDPKVYLYEDLYTMPDRLHNFLLQSAHDYGLAGLLVEMLAGFLIVFAFLKDRNEENVFPFLALVATAVSLLFGFSLTANMVLICYLLALFFVTTYKSKKLELKNAGLKVLLILMAVSFAAFSLFNGYRAISANRTFASALSHFLSNHQQSEEEFGAIAESGLPYRYLHYSMIGLTSYKESPLSEKSLATLGQITAQNFQYMIGAARVAHSRSDASSAIASLQKASALAPDFALVYELWGEYAFDAGDFAGAIKPLEKLLEIAPPYWKKTAANNPTADAFTADQSRIFRKNHPEFWQNPAMLIQAYDKTGNKNGALELMGSVSPLF